MSDVDWNKKDLSNSFINPNSNRGSKYPKYTRGKLIEDFFKSPYLNGRAEEVENFLKLVERKALHANPSNTIALIFTRGNKDIFFCSTNKTPINIPSFITCSTYNHDCDCYVLKYRVISNKHGNRSTQKLIKYFLTQNDLTIINIKEIFQRKISNIYTYSPTNVIKSASIAELAQIT